MATLPDTRDARLSFFGRFTDDIKRDVLRPDEFRVDFGPAPRQPAPAASYKQDGYFVFQNLKVSATDYEVRFESPLYQRRSFLHDLPTAAPVELTYPAEDEIYLSIKTVTPATKRVGFAAIPFLPRILAGAQVRGQGAFTTTLKQNLEGLDVVTADLNSVAGLAPGQLLRVIRSTGLLAKPGPYYPFPDGTTTVLAFKVTDLTSGAAIEGAAAQIQKLNTLTPASTVVGGVTLRHVTLPTPPPGLVAVLGPNRDLATVSDARGQAVFYFPAQWPLTSVELGLTAAGHLPKTMTLAVAAGQRSFAPIALTPA